MTPQVQFDSPDRVRGPDAPSSLIAPPALTSAGPARPLALTDAERQGLAMGWVSIGLGVFLLFGGLALWAAITLHAGFVGWLVSMGGMGLVIVAVLLAVTYTVIRPRR